MNSRLQLINSVSQIKKSYELYSPVAEPEKNSSYKNSIRLSINPEANPFISPSILKSFNTNYVRDNMVSPENYDKAVNIIESASLLASPESAYFIYNSLVSNNSGSAEIITSPISKGGFSLQINQTAQNHIVQGADVTGTDNFAVQSGTYLFSISNDKSNTLISVNLSNNEKYSSVLNKIASAINEKDFGVTASVKTDDINSSKKHLYIFSNETGESGKFMITDIVGELQSLFMPNSNVIQSGRDASITVNGKDITSESNEIILDDYNVLIRLNSKDSSNQNIDISKNTNYIKFIISSFVSNASDFIGELKSLNDAHSQKTLDDIFNSLKPVSGALLEIGISVDFKNRSLSTEQNKLEQAINTNLNFLENTLSGQKGLSNILINELSEYLRTPVDLFSLPVNSYESYSYIPVGYNIFNPYDSKVSSFKI